MFPKAKRAIYLFFSGGPSHIDTYDYKPSLRKIHGMELPNSVRNGQRLTGMTSGQSSFPCVAPMFDFQQHGQHGTWVSELLPHTASIVDDITIIVTLSTRFFWCCSTLRSLRRLLDSLRHLCQLLCGLLQGL